MGLAFIKRARDLLFLAKAVITILAMLSAPLAANAQVIPGALPGSSAALTSGEWPAYAGTYAAARYSPLSQIDRTNAKDLRVVWRWKSPDHIVKDGNPKVGPTHANESTPLMVDGTLYTSTSLSQVAAIDAATGATKWVFDPKIYENGLGNTNVWAPMSADEELGYVYLPVSTPTNDYYGGHRPGDGLYGDSLVCIEAATGKKIWHYQLIRHGLWDYDTPAAPNLIDITVDGRRIKAVAQVTKQAFVYAFDRVTGQPVWPIEDRPVATSSVPGESAAKTQPFPTRPAPIDIQGLHDEDLIDLTPELRKEALDIVAQYDYGPLYTPPSQRGTIQIPGIAGGANWSGAAIDPETSMLYVGTYRLPFVVTVSKPLYGEASYDYIGATRYLPGPRGLPLLKPPFGSLIAIDMNTGEHRWGIPVGRGPVENPVIRHLGIRERLGWPARSWALVTKTVVVVVQMGFGVPRIAGARRIWELNNRDPQLWVYDKATGEMLAEIPMPQNATGSPATYMSGGKQYIVFPVGGGPLVEELIAVAL